MTAMTVPSAPPVPPTLGVVGCWAYLAILESLREDAALVSTLTEDAQLDLLGRRLARLDSLGLVTTDQAKALLGAEGLDTPTGSSAELSVAAILAAARARSAGTEFAAAGPVTTVLAGAGGAAIGGILAGPPGAVIGAALGVAAAELGL